MNVTQLVHASIYEEVDGPQALLLPRAHYS